jgi:hypothetical protein
MRVTFPRNGVCAEVEIPRGEYQVVLHSESNQIVLIGGGMDLKLPATRRRSKSRLKTATVSFYCGGGKLWSLIISTPKQGEWISIIELDD